MSDLSNDTSGALNIFDMIQQICQGFRRELRNRLDLDHLEAIEQNLMLVPEGARSMLFQNLLHVSVSFRRKKGEIPSSDDYLSQFPDYQQLIRQAFFEATMMSVYLPQNELAANPDVADLETQVTQHSEHNTSHQSASGEVELPAATRLGDYELLCELGRGGFGVVYRARHLQRDELVALKTLPAGFEDAEERSSNAERLHKFRREFRTLANLNHPNLVGMQTLEVAGDQWFFTMDLIEGVDFQSFVRPFGLLNESRLRLTIPQLAKGIMALHANHILHRDLKPTNVLVDEQGRVVILDFGLVEEFDQQVVPSESKRPAGFAGTPRYAAPEQLSGNAVAASDWYSFGVMLYEGLTGKAPFRGNATEIKQQKKSESSPRLQGRPELPTDLSMLADQLLLPSPSDRIDALEIARLLSVAETDSSASPSANRIGQKSGSDRVLIGRESQLSQLRKCLEKATQSDSAGCVFVQGRSGEGKTSLTETFLHEAAEQDAAIVLSGRCYDRESVPFKAIDCLIDAICHHLRPWEDKDVIPLLPDDIQMLASLFPVMRRIDAIAHWPGSTGANLDSEQLRFRAFGALREFLQRLSKQSPIALFIDDLQWGDAASAAVIERVLASPDSPTILFIGSYRSDELDKSPFLQRWFDSSQASLNSLQNEDVSVGPLSEPQCIELVQKRTGISNDQIVARARDLYEATGGNPYFLEQLIDCFDADSGSFAPTPIDEVIATKLKRLPDSAAALLEVIAVSGHAINDREAAHAADNPQDAFATLTKMRSEKLIRTSGSEEQPLIDTYHDKIRESLLDGMEMPTYRRIHCKIGESIESEEGLTSEALLASIESGTPSSGDLSAEPGKNLSSSRLFDLAYHFYEANEPRAFAYLFAAGEKAAKGYALEDAHTHLQKAVSLLPAHATGAIRFRLFERMGWVNLRRRQSADALQFYERAATCAPTDFQKAIAHLGIGMVHQQRAIYSLALHSYDDALQHIKRRRPTTTVGNLLSSIISGTRVILGTRRRTRPNDADRALLTELEHELFVRLSAFNHEYDLLRYVQTALRQAVLAIRTDKPHYRANGYGLAANVFAQVAFFRLGKICFRRSERESTQSDDPEVRLRVKFFHAMFHYQLGNLKEAVDGYLDSLAISEQCGESMIYVICAHLLRHAYALTSPASVELECATKELELSIGLDDSRGILWGHTGAAHALARTGKLDLAWEHMSEALSLTEGEPRYMAESTARGIHGYVYMQCSDHKRAQHAAQRGMETLQDNRVYMDFSIRALPYWIESLIGPNWGKESFEGDRRLLMGLIRKSRWFRRVFPLQAPFIDRVCGRAFYQFGNRKKARRLIRQSLASTRAMQANVETAKTLLDMSIIDDELSDAERSALKLEAIELLRRTETVIPFAERWLLESLDSDDRIAENFAF